MRFTYRLTSAAALGSLALPIASVFLPSAAPRPHPVPLEAGAVGFDPCSVWVQIDPMDREPDLKERVIIATQCCISWATLALFLIAAALFVSLMMVRLHNSVRT